MKARGDCLGRVVGPWRSRSQVLQTLAHGGDAKGVGDYTLPRLLSCKPASSVRIMAQPRESADAVCIALTVNRSRCCCVEIVVALRYEHTCGASVVNLDLIEQSLDTSALAVQ